MKQRTYFTTFIIFLVIILSASLISWNHKYEPVSVVDIRKSAAKSLLLLQKSGYLFINRNFAKCASCHHNTLTSMVAEIARQKGVNVIDSFTIHRVKAMENTMAVFNNPNLMGDFVVAANFITPYTLLGLNAEKYAPNFLTDMAVDYLIGQATPDGAFVTESGRPPLETGQAHLTAMAIRALNIYASPAKK